MENNNNAPSISVILPVYNREYCIERAIDSVLKQTFSDWELIIVDDGSTDKTGAICDVYIRHDSRIKVIHTNNAGVSHARNIGLANSSGKWLAFLDSDDIYSERAFEALIDSSSDVDIVMCASAFVPSGHVREMENYKLLTFESDSCFSETAFLYGLYSSVWGKIFRRESLIGEIFDESIVCDEDRIFMLNILKHNLKIRYISDILYCYSQNTDNSLCRCFHISKLSSERKYYELLTKCFSRQQTVTVAKKEFCFMTFCYFYNLVCNSESNKTIRNIIVQSQLDENIKNLVPPIKSEDLPIEYRDVWSIIMTCDAEKLIHWYESNGCDFLRKYSEELNVQFLT